MSDSVWRALATGLGVGLLSVSALGQGSGTTCGNLVIDSSTPTPDGRFGVRLALAGDLLVVGAQDEDHGATRSGAAHVFRRVGGSWVPEQVLHPSVVIPNQRFGGWVATNGETISVYSERNDPSAVLQGNSALHLFRRSGGAWVEVQTFTRVTSTVGVNAFGVRHALEPGGDRILSLVPGQKLFEFGEVGTSWTQTDVYNLGNLPPAHVSAMGSGHLCWDLDLDGDRLGFTATSSANAAFVWERGGGGWFPTHLVQAQYPGQFQYASIALDGDWLVVGVPSEGGFVGAVLVYRFDGAAWQLDQEIDSPVPSQAASFGSDVGLEGDVLVIGAGQHDAQGAIDAGAIHLFRRPPGAAGPFAWAGTATAGLPDDGGLLGHSVVLDGTRVLGGAPGNGGVSPGRVHELPVPIPFGQALEGARPNSTGAPAVLQALGSPVVDHDCLRLEVSSLPVGQFGYFVMGQAQDSVPLFAGSQGHLSLGLPFQRFANDIQNSGLDGRVSFDPDFLSLPQGVQFQPGETWTFQYWTRDAAPMPTSNTSNALALTFESDLAPTVQWPESVVVRDEATALHTFTLTLSQPVTHDVEVEYVTGGTATHLVDWRVEAPSPLVIPALATEIEVPIVIADDLLQEGDETATVTLVNPSGADLGTLPTLTIRIADDD